MSVSKRIIVLKSRLSELNICHHGFRIWIDKNKKSLSSLLSPDTWYTKDDIKMKNDWKKP